MTNVMILILIFVNFPLLDGDIQHAPSYGVLIYIS